MEKALFLTKTLDEQVGGTPEDVIKQMKTKENKYLTFINRQIAFAFDENNKRTLNDSVFLANGSYTAVFSIKLVKNISRFTIDNTIQYILRVESITDDEMEQFIRQWNQDKIQFPKNIIDIFYYGTLMLDSKPIAKYTITRKYHDYDEILKLNFYQKQIFMCNMLRVMDEIIAHGIFYRDFKLYNIGFDNLTDLNFIILDYDFKTLVTSNDKIMIECKNDAKPRDLNENEIAQYNHSSNYCSGTYLPYFMTYGVQDPVNPKFDKAYCIAFAFILCALFFTNDENRNNMMKFIENHAKIAIGKFLLESELIQHGISDPKKWIVNCLNKDICGLINKMLPNFTPTDCEYANIFVTSNTYEDFLGFLQVTIQNMLELEYDNIMYPQRILNLFTRIQTEHVLPKFTTESDIVNAYCKK